MKLVFCDGFLIEEVGGSSVIGRKKFNTLNGKYINAGEGISSCLEQFERYSIQEDAIIQTNLIDLLNYVNYNDIYLMKQTGIDYDSKYDNFNYEIKPLQECCDKELRDCHDVRKLYLSGAFGEVYQIKNEKKGN